MGAYEQAFSRSLEDPEGFWTEASRLVDWIDPPPRAFDPSDPAHPRWFAGGRLNTSANALDRHVDAGRGEQLALVHDSPVTDTVTTRTYRQLRDEVARFAGVLAGLGVGVGDRVVVYMPMVGEAAVAMLACARLGAVHSVVFGGFAPRELAVRIDDAAPAVIVTASCGIEPARVVAYHPLLEEALRLASHRPRACVVLQRERQRAELVPGRDHDWHELMAGAAPADPVPVDASHPLYVLYTSGTTGRPKGVVRDTGGHAVALRWSVEHVYDVHPGEVLWTASDVGWVVGHSYIVYGPLLAGCTSVLYEGKPVGTPDAGAFWRVAEQHGVTTLFTAPTAFRAIRKADPEGALTRGRDLSRLRALFLAGERLDPDTYHWARGLLGIPVVDHWWQTESGWPIVANPLGIEPLPPKPGSPTRPVPGWDVRILDDAGAEAPAGSQGAVTVRLPLPPGAFPTLWQDEERFVASYLARYPGHYLSGDGGYVDDDGYVYVMGRTDDVINVAGHRLSTGVIEEVLAAHPAVAECAVIGVADDLKGQRPVGFVVLKAGAPVEGVVDDLIRMVRAEVGPVAAFRDARVVSALPKTRSGKILRATMRSIADGRPYDTPSTIEDPAALDVVARALDVRVDELR